VRIFEFSEANGPDLDININNPEVKWIIINCFHAVKSE